MTPRKGKRFRTSARAEQAESTASFVLQNPHAAGIDVHSDVHFVAVPPDDVPAGFSNPEPRLPAGVRKFGANTGDLEALATRPDGAPPRCGGSWLEDWRPVNPRLAPQQVKQPCPQVNRRRRQRPASISCSTRGPSAPARSRPC
jgi:hypothetical protein